ASRPLSDIEHMFQALTTRWPQRHSQYGLGELLTLLWDGALKLFAEHEDPVRACLIALSGEKIALDGVNVNIRRVVLSSEAAPACLDDANFSHSTLCDVDLSSTRCHNADFSDTALENVCFRNADLQGSIFNGCLLIDVNFSGANLQECDFTNIIT